MRLCASIYKAFKNAIKIGYRSATWDFVNTIHTAKR